MGKGKGRLGEACHTTHCTCHTFGTLSCTTGNCGCDCGQSRGQAWQVVPSKVGGWVVRGSGNGPNPLGYARPWMHGGRYWMIHIDPEVQEPTMMQPCVQGNLAVGRASIVTFCPPHSPLYSCPPHSCLYLSPESPPTIPVRGACVGPRWLQPWQATDKS